MKQYTTFNQNKFDATKEPMFLGQNVNVARYDQQKYPEIEKYIEKQLSFFWRPEEVGLSLDSKQFHNDLTEAEQHVFLSNLKYQTLLDSVQGRSPNVALLPLVSLPELETWIETWSFSETIHSRSYTHIIRNLLPNPSEVFDDIVTNEAIIERATDVSGYYDRLIEYSQSANVDRRTLMSLIVLCVTSVYALEALRFYVSFACSFSFAQRKLMEGNAKIIKLIARDECLHKASTKFIINKWRSGEEGAEWKEVYQTMKSNMREIFREAANQEKEWAKYLFSKGSIMGLNVDILSQYVEWLTDSSLQQIGIEPVFDVNLKFNPLPWMNGWVNSDNVQVAPQEAEISSYLISQVDANVVTDDFSAFEGAL